MIYAIGDIHGQKDMLDGALALIEADGGPDAQIVFVGDYTDRGPDSKGVIETLINGQKAGRNWTCIKGNHDQMFSHWVRDGNEHDAHIKSGKSWLHPALGGPTTLASYGIAEGNDPVFDRKDGVDHLNTFFAGDKALTKAELLDLSQTSVPQDHLDFLDALPLYHETDDLLFVHAGIKPGVAMPDQDPQDLIWIRGGWLDDTRDHGKLVVHGHTALDTPKHEGNRVNIDGGAGYGRPLVPVVFEGRDAWNLTPDGRVPLRP